MKNKNFTKKLLINKVTIAHLAQDQLGAAKGGVFYPDPGPATGLELSCVGCGGTGALECTVSCTQLLMCN